PPLGGLQGHAGAVDPTADDDQVEALAREGVRFRGLPEGVGSGACGGSATVVAHEPRSRTTGAAAPARSGPFPKGVNAYPDDRPAAVLPAARDSVQRAPPDPGARASGPLRGAADVPLRPDA